MISGQCLIEAVFAYWGKRFDCKPGRFLQVGSLIFPDDEFLNTCIVYIYHVGSCSVLRIDPVVSEVLKLSKGQELASSIFQKDLAIIVMLGMKHNPRLDRDGGGSYNYLDSIEFKPVTSPSPANLVRINPENDWNMIAGLCLSCSSQEVEDSEISEDQPDAVIFGHILDGKLISYAGFRYWDEVFADIGVLTHPMHRGLGLALAGTSSLCEWCLENGIIPMYRVADDNPASCRIQKRLGFRKMVEIEVLKLDS